MTVLDILYFAWVREGIGRDEERLDVPDGVDTVADLIAHLRGRGEPYAAVLADTDRLRAALDQNFVPLDAPLGGARELALFPPVTGG
ncbi:MAG: molybdopterin converting factor subunit 1 [Sphingobium sp.]|nr:molybdopterin converting factor subunit 1 [Sphingobium sp.]